MSSSLWDRFQKHFLEYPEIGLSLDISRMRFADGFLAEMEPAAQRAFASMGELEGGAIANPDEERMVGHYWLRDSRLAPNEQLRHDVDETKRRIQEFAAQVHSGESAGSKGGRFRNLLLIGIGGSALGPQFVADALGRPIDKLAIHFFDNTDPDGFDRVFARLGAELAATLVVVISKSGGTKETRNGMLEAEAWFTAAGLSFRQHAVAVTGVGSELDRHAEKNGWLARFPMFDWIGGRTSVMSAVGLVPAALQGIDIDAFLGGAAAMDAQTRQPTTARNAAMLLALMWHYAGNGRGEKDMVILPYKDRLMLFSRYLQQLVMESLGKEKDLDGKLVHQGIAVYGNKGSTDQHAYVQQLRDGVLNFFVTFIEVRKDRAGQRFEVEEDRTSGDYLHGFLRGTRAALYENGRESITISISEVNAFTVGALIALYERAVGFYASLVNINAYHQPGVEAGKKAATAILDLQRRITSAIGDAPGSSAAEIAQTIGADAEDVFHLLRHLAANDPDIVTAPADRPGEQKFYRRR
ncbi:MAG: Glucose-6-phosphate isomerase [uncultured Chthoniobacterales bacterium]|uniref:Glucose-6-phosphate isomerase n=1 Tax=uncultured Chthoniobacterales bacterium TaxID=1836801 RepID=A0A6J4HGB1_9BACT|nr:MAG: Glucose-6-phosphate isomerase [uncultured Chthoniobacterales bacterium]